ncbi:Flagellar protein FlaG protein [Moorella glycerini]|uniref:Flagellar protein FlaG n=1 Tax=Neomoorella stamsii TaxID=1266720 RepID=A0A9X7J296_9FIRM|nr:MULTISPECIES: flagellar protein FlaG [Moorella]PRR72304.1 flagellar protein FlaG [Moorella stamsii]CEP68885.1 Flagellar protein FlaG protein [Moorella glycerini]
MVRIEGVDPIILNRVQNQTKEPIVQEMKKISITADEERQQREQKEKAQEYLESSVKQINTATELFNIKIRFKLDHENDEIYVLVIDTLEGKVIRRIPPENILKIANQMQYIVGLLLDELI